MIPSLEVWSTKAEEAPSPHEVKLAPLNTNPVYKWKLGELIILMRKTISEIVLWYLLYFLKHLRARINFSELHHEELCEKKLFILVWCKGPQWLGLRDRIFWNFYVLDFFKNAISKCKLRLFEPLKQPHIKMKNIFRTRNA